MNNSQKDKTQDSKREKRVRSLAALNPIKINAHSAPPTKLRLPEKRYNKTTFKNRKVVSRLPPKNGMRNSSKVTNGLPDIKSRGNGKKQPYLLSLREENNRIRDELKDISKQLSMHINQQLRLKSNFGDDEGRELKFIDGNIQNERKRLEIAQYEYEHWRYKLAKEGKTDNQFILKKRLKELTLQ